MARIVISLVIAYLLGNISPATIMAKAKGIDIKHAGSGNAGANNALRVLGKKAGIITAVIDILKGTVAVLIGSFIGGHFVAGLCVLAAFLGHIWPVILRFRGGKGVAVAFGGLLGYNWEAALICFGIVVLTVLLTRRMSAGSVAGAIAFPVIAMIFEPDFVVIGIIMSLIILYKHKSNIRRLIKGEEKPISLFGSLHK